MASNLQEIELLVQVPDGVSAGDQFQFEYMGERHTVTVPAGVVSGDSVNVRLEMMNNPLMSTNSLSSIGELFSSARDLGRRKRMNLRHYFNQLVVHVPPGVRAGEKFTVSYGGLMYILRCPDGVGPGEEVFIDLNMNPDTVSSRSLGPEDSTENLVSAGQASNHALEYAMNRRGFLEDIRLDLTESYQSAICKSLFFLLFTCILLVTLSSFTVGCLLVSKVDDIYTTQATLISKRGTIKEETLEIYPSNKGEIYMPYDCCDGSVLVDWIVTKDALETTYTAPISNACAAYELQLQGASNLTLTVDIGGVDTNISNWEFSINNGIGICENAVCEETTGNDKQDFCLAKIAPAPSSYRESRYAIVLVSLLLPWVYLYLKIQILGMKIDTPLERAAVENEFKCGFLGLHNFQELARVVTTNAFMLSFTLVSISPGGTIYYEGDANYALQTFTTVVMFIGIILIVQASNDNWAGYTGIIVAPFHLFYKIITLDACFNAQGFARIRLNAIHAMDKTIEPPIRRDVILNIILIVMAFGGVASIIVKAVFFFDDDYSFEDFMEAFAATFLGINTDALANLNFDEPASAGASVFSVGSLAVLFMSFLMFLASSTSVFYALVNTAGEIKKAKVEQAIANEEVIDREL